MQRSFLLAQEKLERTYDPPSTHHSPVRDLLGAINTIREGHGLPRLAKTGEYRICTSGRHYVVAAAGET